MPFTAHHDDSGDIHFAAQAEPEDDYSCLDCDESVEYVRSHERDLPNGGITRVSAHFRYSNCTHGTVDEVSENRGGGGGGGGGGGESRLHQRRKRAALQEALNRFPSSQYDTEATIGNKRADALLVFENPHEEYGRGLVIEYQHKNEGKDIEATEVHFAKNEYTTVWLWEDQFSFSQSIPDIDLFGGRVYTPWPDAVPPESEWAGIGLAQEKREGWKRAYQNGLTDSVVEANVLKHWVVPTQEEHWNQSPWLDRFPDENQSTARDFILQVAVGRESTSVTVPATLNRDWILPTPREYWQSEPWHSRFTSTHHYQYDIYIDDEMRGVESELRSRIPFSEWIRSAGGNRPEQIVREILIAYNEHRADPPATLKERKRAIDRVESVVRHHTSGRSGVSLQGVLTVASSYIGVPNDHVRWALNDLRSEGVLELSNGEYRLTD